MWYTFTRWRKTKNPHTTRASVRSQAKTKEYSSQIPSVSHNAIQLIPFFCFVFVSLLSCLRRYRHHHHHHHHRICCCHRLFYHLYVGIYGSFSQSIELYLLKYQHTASLREYYDYARAICIVDTYLLWRFSREYHLYSLHVVVNECICVCPSLLYSHSCTMFVKYRLLKLKISTEKKMWNVMQFDNNLTYLYTCISVSLRCYDVEP